MEEKDVFLKKIIDDLKAQLDTLTNALQAMAKNYEHLKKVTMFPVY